MVAIYERAIEELETIFDSLTTPEALVLSRASYDTMVALDETRVALFESR